MNIHKKWPEHQIANRFRKLVHYRWRWETVMWTESRHTDRQIDRQTDRHRQTDRQTYRHTETDSQTGRQTYKQTETDSQTGRRTDREADKQTDWQTSFIISPSCPWDPFLSIRLIIVTSGVSTFCWFTPPLLLSTSVHGWPLY